MGQAALATVTVWKVRAGVQSATHPEGEGVVQTSETFPGMTPSTDQSIDETKKAEKPAEIPLTGKPGAEDRSSPKGHPTDTRGLAYEWREYNQRVKAETYLTNGIPAKENDCQQSCQALLSIGDYKEQ